MRSLSGSGLLWPRQALLLRRELEALNEALEAQFKAPAPQRAWGGVFGRAWQAPDVFLTQWAAKSSALGSTLGSDVVWVPPGAPRSKSAGGGRQAVNAVRAAQR